MKKLLVLILAIAGLACVAQAATTTMLSPLATFGQNGDGTVRPGDPSPPYPPLIVGTTHTGYPRGYAYDPTTGNTVLVDPNAGNAGDGAGFQGGIYVIDGTYGTNISTLDTNGIVGGTYPGSAAGVAADGKVYMCNQINSSTNGYFIIYSWTNVWQSNSPPYLAFSNHITPVQRYGATMDVRGSGANTQIIVGSKSQDATETGTNVTIFTTTDGVNFTANVLGTDVTTADFADGIAFGVGDTFWAKSRTGHPLRIMSFNLGTSSATTLASFDTNAIAGSFDLGAIALDLSNKRMASLQYFSATAGPQRVWLFDIAATLDDPTKPPVLLDIKTFATQNPFATAPNGFLDFGGANLYCHAINNGLLTLTPASVTTPAPTIWVQPSPSTKRMLTGQKMHYEVVAFPACTYQWQKNGGNIPNATNAVFNIASTSSGDDGTYTVIVSSAAPASVTSDPVTLTVVNPADLWHLELVWATGAGTNCPFAGATGNGTPLERSIAYNALSNELYIVHRNIASGGQWRIFAVDGTTASSTAPPITKILNTNGIGSGTIGLGAIGVAADGAIYACNVDTTGAWKLYRWADSGSNTEPACVWSGDPQSSTQPSGSHFRFGDEMSVRGSGPNTQILIDNTDTSGSGKSPFAVVLMPTNSSMAGFSNVADLVQATLPNTIIGRSIQWESFTDLNDNNFWQMHKGGVIFNETFDFSNPAGWGLASSNISYAGLPSQTAAMFIDVPHSLLFTVRTNNATANTPPSLEVYEVTDPAAAIPIGSYLFPPSSNGGDANCIADIAVSGGYVWALRANNGLLAYRIVSGPPLPPAFAVQPQDLRLLQGGSGSMTVTPDSAVNGYQWLKITPTTTNYVGTSSSTLTFNPAQFSDAASYRCVVSNAYGFGTSSLAVVTVVDPTTTYQFTSAWSATPGSTDTPYVTSDGGSNSPKERSIAYNPLSNQLIVVSCSPSATSFDVNVVDGTSGALLYKLNTNGVVHTLSEVSGSNPMDLLSVAVAEDGAVYICNGVPNASGGTNAPDPSKQFRVYRWADSGPTTAPVNVFAGDPGPPVTGNWRWGDSMDVRGKGMETQIILDSHLGTNGAILAPNVGDLSTFTNAWFNQPYGAGSIGRSLDFGATSTFWEKRKGLPLELISYDLNTQTASVTANNNSWPSTMGGLNVDYRHNLAAGVDFVGAAGSSPDVLKVYEISDLDLPMLIGQYNFPVAKVANANSISKVVFGGNKIYALDGNNGIVVVNIKGLALNVAVAGDKAVISWPGNFISGSFTLYSTLSLTPPITWSSEGAGTLNSGYYWVTNDLSAAAKFYRLQ